MGKLVASAAGLVSIICGAARWLAVLPGAAAPGHHLHGRGLDDRLTALGQVVRQENLLGLLGGSGLVCVGVLVTLRILLSSRVAARGGAKRHAFLFWGLAGGGTVTVHALLVLVHFLRP